MARKKMTDERLLAIVSREWQAAQGEGDRIEEDRARALDYINGDPDRGYVRKDLPPQKGLSKAMSSDVSDAIETVLPDLIEIFTGGEDVVALDPQSEEDEPQAEQETDYINHVFYSKNPGWMILYTAFKDALTSKTGVLKWWWEVEEDTEERTFDALPGQEDIVTAIAEEDGWELVENPDAEEENEEAEGSETDDGFGFNVQPVTLRFSRPIKRGKAKVAAVPPEDFRVDPAASSLEDATWAAMRSRQRVWQLVQDGFDRDTLLDLPEVTLESEDQDDAQARDYDDETVSVTSSETDPMMKLVEVREYHIWLDADDDGEMACWRVVTGGEDTEILSRERIDGIQFEVLCPYPVTHRLYGRSLADLTTEVQKIKTVLMRLLLNHTYFSVNPRPEVSEQGASKFTMADLLNKNLPGSPIRSVSGTAVRWLAPPQMGSDPVGLLEYFSTVSEGRTGVVRNAQGLNPDTLHDTAKGAMELMSAAQRRVRMIARIFAETGLKRFFLGLHDLIVRHADKADYVRLRNGYVEVDPSKWGRRSDLTIDVGLGTNTKTYELQFWQLVLDLQAQAKQLGVNMRPEHFWSAIKRLLKAGNVRNPDLFFPNPATAEEGAEQQEAPPDPETVKAQGELQLKREGQQAKLQLQHQEAASKMQMEQAKFQFEAQLALFKAQTEAGLAERAAETEARIQAIIAERRLDIEEFKAASKAQTDTMSAAISARSKSQAADNSIRNVRLGGELG